MTGRSRWLSAYAVVVYVFLFIPIVVLVIFSFNTSEFNFAWEGFTLDWYPVLFANDRLVDAVSVTLRLAAVTVIGCDDHRDAVWPRAGSPQVPWSRGHGDAAAAADGHAGDRHGPQPADLLLRPVRCPRLVLAAGPGPHHVLHQLRGDHRPRTRREHGSEPRGGGPRPRGVGGRCVPLRDPADHRPGDLVGRAARLRPVVRRLRGDHVQCRGRVIHPADVHLRPDPVRDHAGDQRHLDDHRRGHGGRRARGMAGRARRATTSGRDRRSRSRSGPDGRRRRAPRVVSPPRHPSRCPSQCRSRRCPGRWTGPRANVPG